MKIDVGDLAEAVAKELGGYSSRITEGLKDAVDEVSKECLRDVRRKSPKRTGAYRKGWRRKKVKETATQRSNLIHNATHYHLTHLLENGHALESGGRVEGTPHVGPAAEKALASLEAKAMEVVRGA